MTIRPPLPLSRVALLLPPQLGPKMEWRRRLSSRLPWIWGQTRRQFGRGSGWFCFVLLHFITNYKKLCVHRRPARFPAGSPLRPCPWPVIARTRLLRSPLRAPPPPSGLPGPRPRPHPAPTPSPPPNRSSFGLRGSKTTAAAPPAPRSATARAGGRHSDPPPSVPHGAAGSSAPGTGEAAPGQPSQRRAPCTSPPRAGPLSPASAAPGEYTNNYR